MSFDLGVWDSDIGIRKDQPADIYLRLCEGKVAPNGQSPSVNAFYAELTRKWPEIDSVPDKKIDDVDFCPWSSAIDHSGMHVIMCCTWSKANEVAGFVEQLAAKHGLVFFNPQTNEVKLPQHPKS